ncbi:ead/Ea22-like family protein [Salmonella enterica subsp. enterica serovar Braenderup]
MSNIDKRSLRSKARSASAGEWIKESGDGWEAISSSDDQANGNFIIAHFEGPDAKANREFMQAANPDVVLALLDELDSANGYASAYEAEKWHYHGLAESEGERADRAEKQVEELTMWVKRLAHSLRNARPNSKLHGAAMDYLSHKGLISVEDVLR